MCLKQLKRTHFSFASNSPIITQRLPQQLSIKGAHWRYLRVSHVKSNYYPLFNVRIVTEKCVPVQFNRDLFLKTDTKIYRSCRDTGCKLILARCLWGKIEILQVEYAGNVTEAIFSYAIQAGIDFQKNVSGHKKTYIWS